MRWSSFVIKLFASILTSALIIPAVVTGAAVAEDKQPRKIFSGWLTDYSAYGDTTKGQIQAMDSVVARSELFQQIHPFWYTLKSESSILDKYKTSNSIPIETPIATLKSLGIKILPTITDGTAKGELSAILSRDNSRATLIKTILDLINSKGYDGIDLDFEGFAFVDPLSTWPTIQPRWVKFIQELSVALHAQNKLLSVDTPMLFDPTTGKKGYYFYDWKNIGPFIDRLNLMAYDFHTKQTGAGAIGPISWFEPALKFALTSIPSWKIFIGTPNYGYNWVTRVTGVCPVGTSPTEATTSAPAIFHQNKADVLLAKPGAVVTYNADYGETNIVFQSTFNGFTATSAPTTCTTTHSAWYQDARGYEARARLVAKYQLGGISEWELGYGDQSGFDAVKKVALEIGQYRVSLSFNSDSLVSVYGAPNKYSGVLKLTDGRPVAGAPIFATITRGTQIFKKQIAITDLTGAFNANFAIASSAQVSISSDETVDRLAGITAPVNISVSRLISWSAPASMKAGKSYSIIGEVQPKLVGTQVILQVNGVKIPTLATTTDDQGRFSFMYTPKVAGVLKLAINAALDSTFAESTSESAAVLVR